MAPYVGVAIVLILLSGLGIAIALLLEEDGLVKISFLNNSFSDIAP